MNKSIFFSLLSFFVLAFKGLLGMDAFQDWCLGQMAKSMGKEEDYWLFA